MLSLLSEFRCGQLLMEGTVGDQRVQRCGGWVESGWRVGRGYSDGGWVESTGWGLLMQVIYIYPTPV